MIVNKSISALLAATLMLMACDDIPLPGNLAPENAQFLSAEENQIRQVERKRVQTATAVGCIGGGLIGGVVANQSDLSRNQQILVAGVGCALGGLAGRASGQYVNTRTRDFSNQQQGYRSIIAAADQDIANYRSLNATTSRLVGQQRSKVARLNAQYKAGSLQKDQYRAQIASADTNLRTLRNQTSAIDKQISVMQEDSQKISQSGASTSQLDTRIARLRAEKTRLESNRSALARVYSDVPSDVARVSI